MLSADLNRRRCKTIAGEDSGNAGAERKLYNQNVFTIGFADIGLRDAETTPGTG